MKDSFKGASRPAWCLMGKITHHMETVLFREKFQDWPDAAAVIRVKEEDKIIARAMADEGASGEIEVSAESVNQLFLVNFNHNS